MPKNRLRKTQKAALSSETLDKALRLMANGTSMRKAAEQTGIPFSTRQIRHKKKLYENPSLGREAVFPAEVEKDTADVVKKMANIFYGCTAIQVRKMAYEYNRVTAFNKTEVSLFYKNLEKLWRLINLPPKIFTIVMRQGSQQSKIYQMKRRLRDSELPYNTYLFFKEAV
jgi:hypothetical protein